MKNYLILVLFLIFSCSPTIRNFDNYQKQFLPKSSFLPNKEALENKAPKIVVFPLDENENQIAIQTTLGNTIANNIENIIGKNRLGEIVDRKAAQKLQKEIALAEMNKSGIYKGPIIADYAISGAISNAAFTSQYKDGYVYMDPRNGQFITVPPKYYYTSNVAGNIKIYELPSLSVVETIEFSNEESRSENVRQDGGLSVGAIQIGGKKQEGASRDDNLVRKSSSEAIENIEVNLKNFFAKKGYILEKRIDGKKSIFKINLGSLDGIKKGDKFDVITLIESQNPITQENEIERQIIAQGFVSDKIDLKSSWIIIENSEKFDRIRLGDIVKIKYEKKFFDKLNKFFFSLF